MRGWYIEPGQSTHSFSACCPSLWRSKARMPRSSSSDGPSTTAPAPSAKMTARVPAPGAHVRARWTAPRRRPPGCGGRGRCGSTRPPPRGRRRSRCTGSGCRWPESGRRPARAAGRPRCRARSGPGVEEAYTIASTSAGAIPAASSARSARGERQLGAGLAFPHPAALPDPGPLPDPLVAGVHELGKVVVGDDPVGHGEAGAQETAERHQDVRDWGGGMISRPAPSARIAPRAGIPRSRPARRA